ncbi:MAG: LemA family protein [Candidatus Peribacter sp.]
MIKKPWLIALLVLLVVLVGWAWTGFNGFVGQQENVRNKWAQVETAYQRRVDLVPNLVSTVKGAADFEQSTLTAVTEARTRWLSAGTRTEQLAATQNMESALARLLVTVEAYPELKATEAYRDLMTQLEGTENRIAVARKDYTMPCSSTTWRSAVSRPPCWRGSSALRRRSLLNPPRVPRWRPLSILVNDAPEARSRRHDGRPCVVRGRHGCPGFRCTAE